MQGASKKEETSVEDIPEAQVRARKKAQASIGQRWLTAGIAIPIVLVFAWFGGWIAFAATLLVVVLGTMELNTMLRHAGYNPLTWISLGLSIMFLVAAMLPQQRLIILQITLSAAVLFSFLWILFRKQLDGAMVDWALTLAISIYLGWPVSFFLLLRGDEPGILHIGQGLWVTLPAGAWWLLVVLLGVWGFDSAAFFTGLRFGRHKLAPTISPAKTWEGVIGGLLLSVTAALVLTVVPLGVPWYLAILLGLLIGAAAVFGDLAESLIKRQTHVKDSGQIMPGHGGMLDRIDSLLFAVIIVYFFSQFIGAK